MALLRRVLPEVPPQILAELLGVQSLPPEDISVLCANSDTSAPNTFDIHKQGILDVFLSCIAKAMTVQMKVKGQGGAKGTQIAFKLSDSLPSRQAAWVFSINLELLCRNDLSIFTYLKVLMMFIMLGRCDKFSVFIIDKILTIFYCFHFSSTVLPNRWWLRGTSSPQMAEATITLLKDLASVCGLQYFYFTLLIFKCIHKTVQLDVFSLLKHIFI